MNNFISEEVDKINEDLDQIQKYINQGDQSMITFTLNIIKMRLELLTMINDQSNLEDALNMYIVRGKMIEEDKNNA